MDSPSTNAPSSFTPNHVPNSSALASARHTRERGAFRTAFLSIRSVSAISIRNLLVANLSWTHPNCNLFVAHSIAAWAIIDLGFRRAARAVETELGLFAGSRPKGSDSQHQTRRP